MYSSIMGVKIVINNDINIRQIVALLIGCVCYCPLWPCRPMLYDLGSTANNGRPIVASKIHNGLVNPIME